MSANRLERAMTTLRARGGRGVAPYVTAGDGGYATTLAVLRALDAAGATCVELGLPFSDPIADGPVLQAAAERALRGGATFAGALELIRAFRSGADGSQPSELPILVFSYANPLLRRGWDETARLVADAGGDGLLVPDVPIEEGGAMRRAALANGLAPIFFVAPTTSDERVRAAAEQSRGFLYAIGRFGVTGANTELDETALGFLRRVRSLTDLPLALGFGIRTHEQVRAVTEVADLAIVGSALVQKVHEAFAAANDPAEAARAAGSYLEELIEGVAPSRIDAP
jgi:tryptophan synthase alpha chain